MQNLLPMAKPDGRLALPGFRLKRLEMFNWGTFHGKVERVIPEGRWTMLVGVNGTGKSTAADALRTLLVHPSKTTYNDASGDHKQRISRRDRTRKSYVRGAYGAISQEDSATALTQYLRKEGDQSILLAVFVNEYTAIEVSLGEILWEQNDKIDQLYLIARADKNIKEHLTNLGTSRELKKELKKRGFECFDSFTGYEERFRQLLGIPGTGALEVFNQAIGVKEVTDLNQFIQKHMLEPSRALEFIDSHLKPHYQQLSACWEAIKRAEAQLEKLGPIAENHQKIVEAERSKQTLEVLQEALPHFYNQKHLELRVAYDEELEVEIGKLQQQRDTLQAEQTGDLNQKESIKIEMANSEVGRRLRDIEFEVKEAQRSRDEKMRAADTIRKNLAILQQPVALETEAQFTGLRRKLVTDKGPLEGNLQTQKQKELEHAIAKKQAEEERKRIGEEAQSVRNNRVLIPLKLLEVRREISQATGVPLPELPFAGELMEVADNYREWTGAIERLLHGFGVSLLVPENRYLEVAKYINSAHLGTRLVFHRVPAARPVIRTDFLNDPKRVPARLKFLRDHSLSEWVKSEVVRRFSHTCCADVQQLNQVDYGITKEGLIRDGTRHVKDDTSRVNDRSNYVLGWSTATKLAALEEEFNAANQRVVEHERKYYQAAEQVKAYSAKLDALAAVLEINDYEQINFRPEQEQLDRLHTERERLKKSSDRIRELEKQLAETEERIQQRGQKIQEVDNEKGGKQDRLRENRERVAKLKEALRGVSVDMAALQPQILNLQEEKSLTLQNIIEVKEAVERRVQQRINIQTSVIKKATDAILPAMQAFLSTYPDETADLKAETTYGPEFVALKDKIEQEQLPMHKARFSSFLNTNLIMDMAAFNTKLSEHEKEIRSRIDSVNKSLQHIEYSPGTYVQIVPAPTRSDEIRSFKAELKNCLSGGIMPTASEQDRIFNNIRELISKFEKEKEWTTRVTDARNWLEYGVREIYQKDGKEANYYAASAGRSGGQKSKMAFTILASAITAQYGISGGKDDLNRFRLVVVDEAFARTDEENSQRALDLFKQLGLQLVVINPFDAKGRIVENYVDSYHLISMTDDISHLRRATREEYESARDAN